MFRWLNRKRRGRGPGFSGDQRGVVAIEVAYAVPLLLLIMVGTMEVASMISQAATLHKSLRTGASYAAQVPDPNLTPAQLAIMSNLIKYGNPNGTGNPLLPGWSDAGASLNIDLSGVYDPSGANIPIIRLTAAVPYQPLLPGLVPLDNLRISLKHEQAYVGN